MIPQILKPVDCYDHANAKALLNMFMRAVYKHGATQIRDMGEETIGNAPRAVSLIVWSECSGVDGSVALQPRYP